MLHDPAVCKLGRLPARHDPRTLKLAKYLDDAALPTPPARVDYSSKVAKWEMLANDTLGDCTIAGLLHMIMLWASQNGQEVSFTDQDAIALYSQLCGYVPGNPATDLGGIEINILNVWRKSPIKACTLLGYVEVDPTNWAHVMLAHWLSGSLYMGLNLPLSAQNETIWSSTSDEPGGWGGHCTVSAAYANRGGFQCATTLTAITWGDEKLMTSAWLAKYCDELYAPITPAWFNNAGKAPTGFDLAQLQADLAAI